MKNTSNFPKVLFNVAWLSVGLGLAMEIILLIVAAGFGKSQAWQPIVADLVQKVSWSSLVCMGVAVGTAVSKMRAPLMGLAGLIAAPIAFSVAKALHKSATQALSIPFTVMTGPSPLLLAFMKGLEYAVLGSLIGWVGSKSHLGLRVYALIGLGVGMVFGGAILWITVQQTSTAIPLAGLVSRGVNEVIFPVGCSLVLYAAQQFGIRQK